MNYIRDRYGKVIGYTQDNGSTIYAYKMDEGFVGHYNKDMKITYDKSGRVYSFNDSTESLVRN